VIRLARLEELTSSGSSAAQTNLYWFIIGPFFGQIGLHGDF
jgi:hypothetical protein